MASTAPTDFQFIGTRNAVPVQLLVVQLLRPLDLDASAVGNILDLLGGITRKGD